MPVKVRIPNGHVKELRVIKNVLYFEDDGWAYANHLTAKELERCRMFHFTLLEDRADKKLPQSPISEVGTSIPSESLVETPALNETTNNQEGEAAETPPKEPPYKSLPRQGGRFQKRGE